MSRKCGAAVLVLSLLAACSTGADPESSTSAPPSPGGSAPSISPQTPSPEPSAATPPAGAPSVLTYLDRTTLMQVEVPSGRKKKLGTVPSQDVWAIPGSGSFLVVDDRGGGEDFAAAPVLTLFDPSSGESRALGDGFGPVVHPSGSRVAFLREAEDRVCEGEVCFGGVEVMVTDLDSPPEVLLEAGRWHLLGWAGEDVLVSGGSRPGTFLASSDGALTRLPAAPSEVWDASPDGDHLMLVEESGPRLLDLRSRDSTAVDLDGALADGAWSTEGELLAVELGGRGSKLVGISLEDGVVEEVPRSAGAMGPVFWSADTTAFAYVRARGVELEAVVCEPAGGCSTALTWKEGILPLSLAGP